MEKLTDSEVLARLIYRAYIAPDPHAPLEAEALLPFQAALELYARTWRAEELRNEPPRIFPADLYPWPARGCAPADDRPDGTDCCGDSCTVELPEDPPEEPAPLLREKDLDGFQPINVKLKAAAFAGKSAEEKRQIYARLSAFIAAHGLGTRRRLSELSNGALTVAELQDMTDAHPVPLDKWRIAAACMEKMENDERND